ncbi:TraR/DksA family transcriptional regulator [Nocardioides aurantiacus]|nr:TraR/DksA family transcriptional regulator [Nocardioides aurantiacus]
MDEDEARKLLAQERDEVEGLLRQLGRDEDEVRPDDVNDPGDAGDSVDAAQPIEQEERDDAVEAGLRDKLAAIDRAEQRLAEGTYGRSVLSGDPIPDARLEAQPTAELTVEEAEAQSRS